MKERFTDAEIEMLMERLGYSLVSDNLQSMACDMHLGNSCWGFGWDRDDEPRIVSGDSVFRVGNGSGKYEHRDTIGYSAS